MNRTITILLSSLIIISMIGLYVAEPLSPLQLQAFQSTLIIYFAASLLCFIVSEITQNYSQVDKLWSILPVLYAWNMAALDGFSDRVLLMALLVTTWGIRLTSNFARKGGYSWRFWEGKQDYRWEVLMQVPALKGKWRWRLFNLLFITLYQNGLTLLITYPMLLVVDSGTPIGLADLLVAALFLGFIAFETIADNQQWQFQQEKHAFMTETDLPGTAFHDGFISTGLWGLSRHPNYLGEQCVWLTFYFFSVAATGHWFNWSIAGAFLLILLFRGSARFIESIHVKKYPQYERYQQRVPRFVPKLSLLLRHQ